MSCGECIEVSFEFSQTISAKKKAFIYYSSCKLIDINEMLSLHNIADLINVILKAGVSGGNPEYSPIFSVE